MALSHDELRNFLVGTGRFTQAEIDEFVERAESLEREGRQALLGFQPGSIDPPRPGFRWLGRLGVGTGRLAIDPKPYEPHSSDMDETPSRSEVEAQIAAAEARTDTKFAELRGDLRVISQTMAEVRAGQRATQVLVVGSAIAAVAVIIAALSFGATWFGLGINASDIAHKAADQALREFVAKAPLNR